MSNNCKNKDSILTTSVIKNKKKKNKKKKNKIIINPHFNIQDENNDNLYSTEDYNNNMIVSLWLKEAEFKLTGKKHNRRDYLYPNLVTHLILSFLEEYIPDNIFLELCSLEEKIIIKEKEKQQELIKTEIVNIFNSEYHIKTKEIKRIEDEYYDINNLDDCIDDFYDENPDLEKHKKHIHDEWI